MLEPDVEAAFRRLVGALAGPDPLPAGGAAGVAAMAMGVGLGVKVIDLSPTSTHLVAARDRLESLLARLLPEFATDCAVFAHVLQALRQPRDERIRTAWREATAAPAAVAAIAREAETLLSSCSGQVKPSVAGDLQAALELVRAGRRIAEGNARENAQHLAPEVARQLLAPLDLERDG